MYVAMWRPPCMWPCGDHLTEDYLPIASCSLPIVWSWGPSRRQTSSYSQEWEIHPWRRIWLGEVNTRTWRCFTGPGCSLSLSVCSGVLHNSPHLWLQNFLLHVFFVCKQIVKFVLCHEYNRLRPSSYHSWFVPFVTSQDASYKNIPRKARFWFYSSYANQVFL